MKGTEFGLGLNLFLDLIAPESRFHSVLFIQNDLSPIRMLVGGSICSNLRPRTHKTSVFHEQLQRQSLKFCSYIYNKSTSFKRMQTSKKWLKWPVLLSKTCIKRILKKRFLPLKMKSRFVLVNWIPLILTGTRGKETKFFFITINSLSTESTLTKSI